MAGGGVRTPGPPWPAMLCVKLNTVSLLSFKPFKTTVTIITSFWPSKLAYDTFLARGSSYIHSAFHLD